MRAGGGPALLPWPTNHPLDLTREQLQSGLGSLNSQIQIFTNFGIHRSSENKTSTDED